MMVRVRPGRRLILACGAGALLCAAALVAGAPIGITGWATLGWIAALAAAAVGDFALSRRAWVRTPVTMSRRLPSAFAIGVAARVQLLLDSPSSVAWDGELYDHIDGTLVSPDLPLRLHVPPGKRLYASYQVTPTRRGEVSFAPASLRLTSRGGLCELLVRLGQDDMRRVYPDFAQVARYSWLAGDRRLQEIGIKNYLRRGEGTDFRQLADYQAGGSVRHIDWKASLRLDKPVVREFQDERDQCVLLLVDCGRRMRADDRTTGIGTSHFDQVLNAVMLLTYVALKQGDAVGAITFGTPPGERRAVPPRKGPVALNALIGELYGLQPSPTHSDYLAAAQDLMLRHGKRALVVVITNFRDEDSRELGQALRLLRSRHLVMLASLREAAVADMLAQPLTRGEAIVEVASAHLYEQARRRAFNRLSARDALMVDAEPARLGVELVNRYHAVKRAGVI